MWGRRGVCDLICRVGEEVEHGLDLFALDDHGLGGGLLEDLGADELGGFDGEVGVLDLGEGFGGVGEFGLEGAGFGFDRVDAVADSATAAGDFGGGLLGEVLGGFGVCL